MEVEENIWESAESARQIEKLVQVEQEIVRLMELASQGMSLLALPQTDSSEEARTLPRGPNRSDAFANTAESYFKTLNTIQTGIRTSIARVRAARISPNALRAPEGRLGNSRSLGASIPRETAGEAGDSSARSARSELGFQELKVEAAAWMGLADALEEVVRASRAAAPEDQLSIG